MSERRIAERFTVKLPLYYRRLDQKDFTRAESVNISESGLCVKLPEPESVERVLQLRCLFPGGEELSDALGRVVWLKRGLATAETGIELMDVGSGFIEKARAFKG
jgi:hypothetical protein